MRKGRRNLTLFSFHLRKNLNFPLNCGMTISIYTIVLLGVFTILGFYTFVLLVIDFFKKDDESRN